MAPVVPPEVQRRAADIRLAVFDVDGVMTDGRLYYDEAGRELKAFFTQDGLGLKRLMRAGMVVGIITGRDNPIVNHRMAELGITRLVVGCDEKGQALNEMADAEGIDLQATAYVGDDLIDVPALERAGLAISVPNAHHSALDVAHWITPRPGGSGAVRDVCDLLMLTSAAG